MAERRHPALIGAFVLGAIAITAAAVMVVGSGRFFRNTHTFVLYFQGSVNGLEKGAAVKFRGVPIGTVSDILLALPEHRGDPRVPVLIEIDYGKLGELGLTRDMTSGPGFMSRLRDAGLRGQLQQQSFITGILYIGLDFFPNTPGALVLEGQGPYPEIPTLPTKLEVAQAKLEEIFERMNKIDFEALGRSIGGAIDGLNGLVNSPDVKMNLVALHGALTEIRAAAVSLREGTGPLAKNLNGATSDLRAAIDRLSKSLERIDALTDPNAPVVHGLAQSLNELGAAARAVRQLANDLDRDPSVLLKGKKAP